MFLVYFIGIMTVVMCLGSLALMYYIKHTPTEDDDE